MCLAFMSGGGGDTGGVTKPVTPVQVCVSTFVNVTPLDTAGQFAMCTHVCGNNTGYSNKTIGTSPAVFVMTKTRSFLTGGQAICSCVYAILYETSGHLQLSLSQPKPDIFDGKLGHLRLWLSCAECFCALDKPEHKHSIVTIEKFKIKTKI